MRKSTFFMSIVAILLLCSSNDKNHFDLKQEISSKKSASYPGERMDLSNGLIEMTLMTGGYFTIGTISGHPATPFDDHSQITYGHPFAFTSFPVIQLDDEWKMAGDIYSNLPQSLHHQTDTLSWIAMDSTGMKTTFMMILPDSTSTIYFVIELENQDAVSHSAAAGFVLDPALGRSGDGRLLLNNQPVSRDTLINAGVPGTLEVYERAVDPKGLGLIIDFQQYSPASVNIDNWFDIYSGFGPGSNSVNEIYDLALCIKFPQTVIQPNESERIEFTVEIPEPDISEIPFIRWDLPSFVMVDNNKISPSYLISYAEVINPSGQESGELTLVLEANKLMSEWNANDPITLLPGESKFLEVPVSIPDVYQETFLNLEMLLKSGESVIDQVTKPFFIPPVPFTDSGLLVELDTILLDEHPFVDVKFSSSIIESGQLIYDLKPYNIFLYEDEQQIPDFDLDKDLSGGQNKADIVFVLDVTGSMSEEINGVKENLLEFTDSLSYRGIDFRVGMVTFLDIIENVYNFTSDVQEFQGYIRDQYAHGGADTPENSLEALFKGSQFEWRPEANKVIIWITDANYHINDGNWTQFTKQDIINAMLSKGIIVHCIGNSTFRVDYYDQIVMSTGGNYYDIYGNFRDILLDISRFQTSSRYILSYLSEHSSGTHEVMLEIHYAGLGGVDSLNYSIGKKSIISGIEPELKCNPNPFFPRTMVTVENMAGLHGRIEVYNLIGQKVIEFTIDKGQDQANFAFDPGSYRLDNPAAGLYLLKLILFDNENKTIYTDTEKLIYLHY
ncbi:MAG: VWA domain-containing protein [Bacteroidales bacterium]|nr:VWA domain-containing protein [Bacteroidales bacterium]